VNCCKPGLMCWFPLQSFVQGAQFSVSCFFDACSFCWRNRDGFTGFKRTTVKSAAVIRESTKQTVHYVLNYQ